MAQQQLVEFKDELYTWDEDLRQYLCTHRNAYIEPRCCSGVDSEGNMDCKCGGLYCDNLDCQGIEDWEVSILIEQLRGDYDEYNDED